MESNSKKYPEAWAFFIEHARNIKGCEDESLGLYRVPHPTEEICLYSNHIGELFLKLKAVFYEPSLDSPSVYGKVQYIVTHF